MDLKLNEISDNVYYISDATNVGIICEKTYSHLNFYLVDTCGSPDRASDILEILETLAEKFKCKWKLKAIFVTHSHADHISCCAFLKEKTQCQIFCTQEERGNLEKQTYEQAVICGGWPLPELQAPFYQARPVLDAQLIKPESSLLLCDGTKITFIALPGHHFGMTGVLVKTVSGKEVFFAADSIFDRDRMKKYWIPFLLDVGSFKMTLRKIVTLNADFLLPSHGTLLKNHEIESTAELNRYAVLTTEKDICTILKQPHTQEELLKTIFEQNKIPQRLGQYVLIGCTIRSYVSYLYRCGKIACQMKDNLLYWQTISQ